MTCGPGWLNKNQNQKGNTGMKNTRKKPEPPKPKRADSTSSFSFATTLALLVVIFGIGSYFVLAKHLRRMQVYVPKGLRAKLPLRSTPVDCPHGQLGQGPINLEMSQKRSNPSLPTSLLSLLLVLTMPLLQLDQLVGGCVGEGWGCVGLDLFFAKSANVMFFAKNGSTPILCKKCQCYISCK